MARIRTLRQTLAEPLIEVPENTQDQDSVQMIRFKSNKPIRRKGKFYKFRPAVYVLLSLLIIGAAFLFVKYGVIPARNVLVAVDSLKFNVKSLAKDFGAKNLSNLDIYLGRIENDIYSISKEIDTFDFLGSIEFTKGYYKNFQLAKDILVQGNDLLMEVFPKFKNILASSGFDVQNDKVVKQSSDVEGDTFSLIMEELPLYLDVYNQSTPKILKLIETVNQIDENYIPAVGSFNLQDDLVDLKKVLADFPTTSQKMIDFIQYIPEIIGSSKPTTYLLLLQNETEMRGSGGLLSAYGIMTLNKGDFGDGIDFVDMWDLQRDLWYLASPEVGLIDRMPEDNIYGQKYLMNMGCGGTESRAQDVGMYPDLFVSTFMFKKYYDLARAYFPNKYAAYDHIIIVNHTFAERMISLIQPLEVEGFGNVTAESLFDFIKAETDNEDKYVGYDPERKAIVGKIAKAAKEKMFNLPLDKMPDLIKTIVATVQAKDISLSTTDATMQAYFDKYGLTARTVNDFQGDYFQLNEAQNCALKLNKFVRDSVTQDIFIESDGRIRKNVYIHWEQGVVYNGALYKQYSPTLQWSYRAWVRLFMPNGSYNVNSDGLSRSTTLGFLYYIPQLYFDQRMQKLVSDNIIQFDHRRMSETDPPAVQELNVSYNLPDSINYNTNGEYSLLIQKHPGKSWIEWGGEIYKVRIHYNGQVFESPQLFLDRDKVIKFKDGVITVDNYDKRLDWIVETINTIPWDKI